MATIVKVLQVIVALGIYNVWLLRSGRSTSWRGGAAKNMKEEFEVYGLAESLMRVVGFLKLSFATLLIAGLWFPVVTRPAAIGLGALMLGAVAMHFKVQDPPLKALPALTMLVSCLIVALV